MFRSKSINAVLFAAIVYLFAATPGAFAKVTAEEAARLKKDLTPLGAIRAGNAAGTIPAWTGGITAPPERLGYKGPGDFHPDPFPEDKVLYSVTAQNLDQYADKVSAGQQALLRKYPDTYRLDIYPSRRTHAAPQWVYDNTYANALRAEASPDGLSLTGAYGGVAFPIPKNGVEAMWNHLTRWEGMGSHQYFTHYLVLPSGKLVVLTGGELDLSYPYYRKDQGIEDFNGDYYYNFTKMTRPARKAGEIMLVKDPLNQSERPRAAWQYLVGQRRVRRAPTIAYDTPASQMSGVILFDDAWLFNGAMDRFDWKLIGRKEMYLPYNNYKIELLEDAKTVLTPRHFNSDYSRWELHRVWVVEATLKKGKRHVYSKRVFYLDEDCWNVTLADNYDGRGSLWRTSYANLKNVYELPGVVHRAQVYYDLQKVEYACGSCQIGAKRLQKYGEPKPEKFFTPEQVRRAGRR